VIGKNTFTGMYFMPQASTSFLNQLEVGLREIQDELSELKEILAMRRRDRVCREFKYELAALRFETILVRYAHISQKAGFRRDQPRRPKGTEEGGQWSGGTGTEPPSTEPAANPKAIIWCRENSIAMSHCSRKRGESLSRRPRVLLMERHTVTIRHIRSIITQ